MKKYILTIDQGTTSTRAIIFDKKGNVMAKTSIEINNFFPDISYVEQDAIEILDSVKKVIKEVFNYTTIRPHQIDSIGITNQRETSVLWDKETGYPVYNAIVWQSKQSNKICEKLKEDNHEAYIKDATGLPIDSYFSATKIRWILDNVDGVEELALKNRLMFGTIDTWILWNISKNNVHLTDYTNASRTMLYNINTLEWDKKIINILNLNNVILPKVCNNSMIYDYIDENLFFNIKIPIASLIGDQQASLFGQTCFDTGSVKNTYGTGCFILMNTGNQIVKSNNGLISTIAYSFNNKMYYALEGSIFVGGSAIQWLRDGLKILNDVEESEIKANKVEDNGGVYIVPAFVGLGTPYWDMEIKGSIFGITRATTDNHITRAMLESIAYQSKDIIDLMIRDANLTLEYLKVDGNACNNNILMQFQADILNTIIDLSNTCEVTALGACYMAGLATGYYKDLDDIRNNYQVKKTYLPRMSLKQIKHYYSMWQKALKACQCFK